MKPDNFGKAVNVSLHHFSDASELEHGQCSYIRMLMKWAELIAACY